MFANFANFLSHAISSRVSIEQHELQAEEKSGEMKADDDINAAGKYKGHVCTRGNLSLQLAMQFLPKKILQVAVSICI